MRKVIRRLPSRHKSTEQARETAEAVREPHPVFLRGVIRLFVIRQAIQKPTYGYAVRKALQQRGYDLSPGTLYPLLHACEEEGLLQSFTEYHKKRVRVHYRATDTGKAYYNQARAAVTRLMGKDTAPALREDRNHKDSRVETVGIGFFA